MITIGFSTRENNPKYIEYLQKTSTCKNVQIIQKVNNGEKSLSQVYNEIIDESKHDIVVLVHDDLKFETGWGKKIIQDFENEPEFAIIGKAGSCHFPKSGIYWENMQQTMVGQVYHHPKDQKKWLSKYSSKLPFLIPVVTIDGLFISFDKNKIKHRFDESIGRFHFYDHLFCVPNFIDGVKIGVTSSFEITHESVGQPNDEFFTSKDQFLNKWLHVLPLDLKPKSVYVPEIKEKPMKQDGKVAIIIPTKGKVKMLFDCVKSFYDHCNHELFKVFIADTGSTDEEKEWIKQNILGLGDIKLIEYDYYNFAKINNDVVKNHVTDEFKYILFSNNDIKVLNNVIYDMLLIFKTNKNTGTVGCRLHFEDNTIQHDGIFIGLDKTNNIRIGHFGFKSYYNFNLHIRNVCGSTGGFLMITKKTFENCGMFNESYIECFEDVELNLKSEIMGLKNFMSGRSVAYHFESQTRNNIEEEEKNNKMGLDLSERLLPFIKQNFTKIKNIVNFNQ